MFAALGYEVSELKRVSYGPLKLKGLREGAVRPLAPHEVAELKKL
jgi:16S rRNA U516 pseudouridylate synthase RsuA-like enzyme